MIEHERGGEIVIDEGGVLLFPVDLHPLVEHVLAFPHQGGIAGERLVLPVVLALKTIDVIPLALQFLSFQQRQFLRGIDIVGDTSVEVVIKQARHGCLDLIDHYLR